MGISASHHRRTLSSNINYPQVEHEEASPSYQYGRTTKMPISSINYTSRMRSYENVPLPRPHSNEHHSDNLPFDMSKNTKLRSSLRKYSNPSPHFGTSSLITQQQQQQQQQLTKPHNTSPTKTPSDSLTSDDSSYLSAREGSISSQSRVRFSPDILLDQSAIATSVNTPLRRLSRSQRHSISDMLAPSPSS